MNAATPAQPPVACKVYTPLRLAEAMIDAIRKPEAQEWLEPSCGRGVFLGAIHRHGIAADVITAIDIDSETSPADGCARVLRGVDFLEWSLQQSQLFDCVVGNPPYVAIKSLEGPLRSAAADVLDFDGTPVGLRANTWYAFLLQSIRLLRNRGGMAFVLPAACEYADYSIRGRTILTRLFDRVDLIRSRRPLFRGVHEGSVVLVCRGKGGLTRLFRRHEVDGLDDVVKCLGALSVAVARACPTEIPRRQSETVPLSEAVEVRIGGVTGDAAYFVLSESQRRTHELPRATVRPIVSRSRHVVGGMVRKQEWQRMLSDDERVWLFCPEEEHASKPSVKRYLDLSVADGGCQRERYKIKNREPWYRTPMPTSVDGFVSGMSGRGIWICMNEMPKLSATNTLYVVKFREACSRVEKYTWALTLLTTSVAKQISRSTRVYADGLQKIEPGQLERLQLPVPPKVSNAISLYRSAVNHLISGDESGARAIADKAILCTTRSK